MKKRIKNNTYDTNTSRPIGAIISRPNPSPTAWKARLYRTPKTKQYFLAGTGGFMTCFGGDHKIVLLTKDQAVVWANNYLDGESIKELTE